MNRNGNSFTKEVKSLNKTFGRWYSITLEFLYKESRKVGELKNKREKKRKLKKNNKNRRKPKRRLQLLKKRQKQYNSSQKMINRDQLLHLRKIYLQKNLFNKLSKVQITRNKFHL